MDSSVDSLRHVDPTPIELDDIVEKPIPPPPLIKKIIPYLRATQKYSAYAFCGFVGLHLLTVVVIPGLGSSLGVSQEAFEMARNVYHGIPFAETFMITGAVITHVVSGLCLRITNLFFNKSRRKPSNDHEIIKNGSRDDIGLGGITGLIGLGYRKSMILRYVPGLNPLSFLGYVLIPLVAWHYVKFRFSPVSVDDDSALVSLGYVGTVLTKSQLGQLGNIINYAALLLLTWTGSYHFTSGMLRYQRKFSLRWKKIGYSIIGAMTFLAMVSMWRLRRMELDSFLQKTFTKYVLAVLL